MSARIISVANRKGGVSKTSTGLFLATALARKGRKVIYLDCDSQASAHQYRLFEKGNVYKDIEEPYKIKKTDPTYVFEDLPDYFEKYDIIFIDIPRQTDGEGDSKIASILAICDSVLIPIKSGELDNLSTLGFVKMIQQIEEHKKKKGKNYQYGAFLSMTGRRPTDDKDAKEFVKGLGIPFLESELRDLREFSRPYTFDSLLDKGKAERERFEPFFKEVVTFFNL